MAPDVALTVAGVKGYKAGKKPTKAEAPKPPTIDELKAQSSALYDIVDNAGIRVSDEAFSAAVDSIAANVRGSGARRSLAPKTWKALDELAVDAKAGNITLKQVEELRRVLKKAQGGVDADKASATRALREYDKFIENLKPNQLTGAAGKETVEYLKSARSLWSRARKTEIIEEIIRKAKIDSESGTMTSGYSHSLRVQFRALAKNKKKMDTFTKTEQAVIRSAATGNKFERAVRLLGKLAPTNQISILGDVAAGLGVGAMAGGPAGGAVGLSLPIVGGLARRASNKRMEAYATQASETMRRGN